MRTACSHFTCACQDLVSIQPSGTVPLSLHRCPNGTYVADNKCVQCSNCATGKVETDACTATSNTACLDCMHDSSGTLLGTHAKNKFAGRIKLPFSASNAYIPVVAVKSRRYGMAPAHIPVFLFQKSSTENGINRPANLFLAWILGHFTY